jgi:hypothetical protein
MSDTVNLADAEAVGTLAGKTLAELGLTSTESVERLTQQAFDGYASLALRHGYEPTSVDRLAFSFAFRRGAGLSLSPKLPQEMLDEAMHVPA